MIPTAIAQTSAPPRADDLDKNPASQVGLADGPDTAGFEQQSLGGVFDSSFDLYKRHFGLLALIVACVFIPTQVLLHAAGNLWLRPLTAHYNPSSPDITAGFQIFALVTLIGAPQNGIPGYLALLTSFMASGPVAVAVASILVGRPPSIAAAYRRVVPVFWRLFWTWNLFFLVYFLILVLVTVLVFVVLVVLGMTGAGSVGGPELGIAMVVLLAALPYIACCLVGTAMFVFVPPLIALENLTVLSAIERNMQLVSRQAFWRMSLALMLLPIVTFGLQFCMLLSASSVVEALRWPSWAGFALNTGLSSLISFFFQPYWMISITLLYFDCRVRREGLDVRYLADNLPDLPTAAPEEPPVTAGPAGMNDAAQGPQAFDIGGQSPRNEAVRQ